MKIPFLSFVCVSYSVICSGFFQRRLFGGLYSLANRLNANQGNKYPLSHNYYEQFLKKLNAQNATYEEKYKRVHSENPYFPVINVGNNSQPQLKIIINRNSLAPFEEMFKNTFEPAGGGGGGGDGENEQDGDDDSRDVGERHEDEEAEYRRRFYGNRGGGSGSGGEKKKKSKNFEIVSNTNITFANIGGYDSVKQELFQCVDLLTNHSKYAGYNVRIPKGLIFEGPPGNGKTLLAKAFAGECGVSFIPVSGSEFQEKYIGVGASRIRELFQLAKDNLPCIIFIDEIDALGRARSNDGETSSSERDSTLNELLVGLDGFKNMTGIFLIGATNRADLLDPALVRPGRVDKRIFIGLPDETTRRAIIQIHIRGKPHDSTIILENLVDITKGYSAAQIENILNEAMLNALKCGRTEMSMTDIDLVLQKMLAGWQPVDHSFTPELIHQIAVHEMGHALVGLYSSHHSRMSKIVINLSSPNNPAYTIFEQADSTIFTREALFEHLAILLAGRLAEELCFGMSITTGAINDFQEAFKLAEKMIIHYGMGKYKLIYPSLSDKYKEMIDNEVSELINDAILYATSILNNKKELVLEGAQLLMEQKVVHADTLIEVIERKYPHV
jgi:ATP-dependent metalloprotease FtsH